MTEIKVKANIEVQKMKIIPKILWGIDNVGFVFIYFKMKDVETNKFLKEVYSIMYQNPSKYPDSEVLKRMDKIIEYIKGVYPTTDIRRFNSRNHMFIKGKIFYEYDKIVRFYNNLISNIVIEIANNINPQVVNKIKKGERNAQGEFDNYDYTKTLGVLNYYDNR
jgi:hypothetical protein